MSLSESQKVKLRIIAKSPLTEIRVSDTRFRRVELPGNTGSVEVELSPGVYEVAFRDGSFWERQVALVTADGHVTEITQAGDAASTPLQPNNTPAIAQHVEAALRSAAPLSDTDDDFASSLLSDSPGELCHVALAVRNVAGCGVSTSEASEAAGLTLVGVSGDRVNPRSFDASGRSAVFSVRPGVWRVRLESSTEPDALLLETPLVLCAGWNTVVYFPGKQYHRSAAARADLSCASIRMMRTEWEAVRTRRARASALAALTAGRRLYGEDFELLLKSLTYGEYDDPMLGLYAAYLIRGEIKDGIEHVKSEQLSLLDEIIQFFSKVAEPEGVLHPDLVALRVRLRLLRGEPIDNVAATTQVDVPPMMFLGWQILLRLSEKSEHVVAPGSLADAAAAQLWGGGPSLVWAARAADLQRWESWDRDRSRGGLRSGIVRTRGVTPVTTPKTGAFGLTEDAIPMIAAALRHRDIRERLRRINLSREDRLVAQALAPFADSEAEQRKLEAVQKALGSRPCGTRLPRADLARQLRLPLTTLERSLQSLASQIEQLSLDTGLDLKGRSHMAVPELIIPYDSSFLGDGFSVPLPELNPTLGAAALDDGEVLDYTHFSLVMHKPRRVAIYTAANIDAARLVKVPRTNKWQMDERAGEHQLGPEAYSDNQLDRGHLVRRQDVVWGSVAEARKANAATFFYTNAAPQHQNFNQDEWVTLEDWVLQRATDFSYRLCVFTGPVLRDNDPVLGDLPPELRAAFRARGAAQIPAAFWKIIVLRDATAGGDDLSVVCFAMRQSDMWQDKQGKKLLKLKVHQVPIQAIEEWTGLHFGSLGQADELNWSLRARSAADDADVYPEIRSADDIVFTGPERRAAGMRAARNAANTNQSRSAHSRTHVSADSDCGCGDKHDEFDARSAIAAVNKEVARLTEALATMATARTDAEIRTRSVGPEEPSPADKLVIEADAVAAHAPAAIRAEVRDRWLRIAKHSAQARGTLPVEEPAELHRIVGGDRVPPGGFPSCCCIGSATKWSCTGVLVAPSVVLTAAHCGHAITRVMIGGNEVAPLDPDGRVIGVRKVVVHPKYDDIKSANDITVLILDRDAPVAFVKVATPEQLRGVADVELVGFGYNDPQRPLGFGVKRRVTAPMGPVRLSPEDDLGGLESLLGFHGDYEFAAGRKGLGRDTCNGDSGGPAYIRSGAGFAVAGLTSRASKGGTVNCGDGGLYVRPDSFRTWINEVIRNAGLNTLI